MKADFSLKKAVIALKRMSDCRFCCWLWLHFFFQSAEISKSFPADFDDLFNVDRVCASLTGFETNLSETDVFVVVGKIGGYHDIGNVIIPGKLVYVLFNKGGFHQTERCVCIRYFYAEKYS